MILGLTRARRRLDDAWHSFVLDKRQPQSVKPEILRSWQRASAEWRIDPALRRCLGSLEANELHARAESEETLRVAAPLLKDFADRLAPDGHAIVYCDADGVALTLDGNSRTCDHLADINFAPGACWSESSTGTNGIGTALVEGRPVEVFASEHFVEAWQRWNCAGSPVRAGGRIVGALDITSPWENRHPTLLVCAEALARAIEGRLDAIAMRREELIRRVLREKGGSGWLAFDQNGSSVAFGPGAGLAGNDRVVQAALGPILARLRRLEGDFEHVIEVSGRSFRVVCSPVLEEGRTIGGVLRIATATVGRSKPALPAADRIYRFDDILGDSAELKGQIALARSAAASRLPILILGESGTGKELFAQALHRASDRALQPFVAINCGAIPDSLVEAELFGYERGSFTGGRKEGRRGRFEDADGGTLFLDEVSELSALAQTAFLRVLEEHEVVRIGSSTSRPIDVRIIAASNKDLRSRIEDRQFRPDLYYRLDGLTLELPPLRSRKDDVPALAQHYLTHAQREAHRTGLTFSWETKTALVAYDWPGNVRELKNVVERAVVIAAGPEILPSDLPREVRSAVAAIGEDRRVVVESSPSALVVAADRSDGESAALLHALEQCSWNMVRAARALGVSRRTMYRKIRKYGLARPVSSGHPTHAAREWGPFTGPQHP